MDFKWFISQTDRNSETEATNENKTSRVWQQAGAGPWLRWKTWGVAQVKFHSHVYKYLPTHTQHFHNTYNHSFSSLALSQLIL